MPISVTHRRESLIRITVVSASVAPCPPFRFMSIPQRQPWTSYWGWNGTCTSSPFRSRPEAFRSWSCRLDPKSLWSRRRVRSLRWKLLQLKVRHIQRLWNVIQDQLWILYLHHLRSFRLLCLHQRNIKQRLLKSMVWLPVCPQTGK